MRPRRYTELFQVRTESGRLIGTACAIEGAEYIANAGRRRDIWRWFEDRYIHVGTYGSGT